MFGPVTQLWAAADLVCYQGSIRKNVSFRLTDFCLIRSLSYLTSWEFLGLPNKNLAHVDQKKLLQKEFLDLARLC